jgi:glycerol uptake facilitator-like aquaporin
MISKIFTLNKILKYIIEELIGRFVAFSVALWCSKFFTHYTYERKSVRNLFGLVKRKKIAVNDMPDWLQMLTIAIIGFIIMETINHFLELPQVKSKISSGVDRFLNFIKKKQNSENSDFSS